MPPTTPPARPALAFLLLPFVTLSACLGPPPGTAEAFRLLPAFERVVRPLAETTPSPEEDAEPPEFRFESGSVYAGGTWVPALWARPDEDVEEFDDDLYFEERPERGDGWAAELGVRGGHLGLGLLYLTGEHDVHRLPAVDARFHGGFLEAQVFVDDSPRANGLTGSLAAGVGFAGLDFEGGPDDTFEAAYELRGTAGYRVGGFLAFELGGGYFAWGHPEETIGEGYFLTLGLTLSF